ncbi:DNA helicase II [Hwanghaeella grinnelliae]|uniref:DNA 3'-5' helicase n=1 Tax=Hwanghaeella grinnelliae TaxID=2500179 RepID=A0A3S2VMY1_9PROT|nr:UvrD-helicase domain-containing protein [Hwanghaeella grinnelliae]RVU34629.1 DNA helicase II [Hwanghaeella grinnelliae]
MSDSFSDDPLAYDDLGVPGAPQGPAPAHPRAGPPPWLERLNEAQRKAVDTLDGPLLVLAGAGTGKTRVLTTRLAHLIHQGKARPYQILCVTFTNKAAREMRERVAELVGGTTEGMWLGTFHALAARILRRHAELVSLKPSFTILDTDDQIRLLKQILQAEHVDEKRWPARMLIHVIQRWKDKGLAPDRVGAGEAGDLVNGKAVDIYRQYQERLITLNAADFGDLMLHNLTIFTKHPDVLEQYQRMFRYCLVDEYQDTNVSQYLWLRLLAQKNKNICCVGDDDQSIYGWRGAEVGNILRFEKDFPGAAVVRLERNYRSTPHILGAASGLIAKNEGRLGKTLWTDEEDGEPVRVRGVWDGEEEARQVGDEIETQHRKRVSLDEMAILVRAGFQTREFEERLITLGIPYKVIGGARFYEREEIRDAIAYLRVVAQPADDLALERIINKPARKIGKATEQAIHDLQRRTGDPMYFAARQLVQTDELKPQARNALTGILNDFDRWRSMADGIGQVELTETILDESGYTLMWQQSKKPEAPGKLENLKELTVAMEEFATLGEFLEHVSLVMDNEDRSDEEQVSLMTLHAAKGLEFDVIFLPGWEEGLFPSQRTMDENGMAGLEEERRLAYVGLTRARKRAFISFAANRRIHGQWTSAIPSRFIDELPQDFVEVESDRGVYAGIGGGSAEDRADFIYGGGYSGGYGAGRSAGSDVSLRSDGPDPQAYRSAGGGPGWQRLRQRGVGGTKPPVIEGRAESRIVESHDFGEGERCFHQKFGPGTIMKIDGDNLTIEFDKAGTKRVVAGFVERT